MTTKTLLVLTTLMLVAVASATGNEKQKKAGMIGGVNDFDAKPPADAKEAALRKFESSRDKLEGSYNSLFKLTKPVVAQVQSQVVSGVMYHFTVIAGLSTCRKGEVDFSLCSLNPQPLRQAFIECKIRVWSQPWKTFLEAQDFNIDKDCKPSELMMPEEI